MTNNHIFWRGFIPYDDFNLDTGGTYKYDLAPTASSDVSGADIKIPFSYSGLLTNRWVVANAENRRKWVSTRTISKKEAKIFHDELHAMLKKARAEKKRREILGLEIKSLEPFPLSDVFRKYRIIRGEPSPSAVSKFNRFVKWLKANYPKIVDINKITKRIVFEYF